FDASGAPVGAEFRVNTTTDGSVQFASVGWDRMGHIAAVWSTTGSASGLGDGIYAQRYVVGSDNLDAPDSGTADAATTAARPTGFRLQDLVGSTTSDFTATVSLAQLADLGSLGNLLNPTDNAPTQQSFDDFFAAAALDPVQEDVLSPLLAGTGM